MKIELGGGSRGKTGFLNLDLREPCDIEIDLEEVGRGRLALPFDDDSINEVYTSHCWEHIDPYNGLLIELARTCKLGARVEIRVPHWGNPMANCSGHKHVMSENQVRHWSEFRDTWWPGCKKILSMPEVSYVPDSAHFDRAKKLCRNWTDEDIYRFMPSTCHEVAYVMTMIAS